jgi:hypothetical protein
MEYLAIDKDGFAVNHINADADFNPGEGLHLEPVGNQQWRPAILAPIIPVTVALWQARAALLGAGKLDAVNAAVAKIGGAVAIAWDYGNSIDRASPTVAALGATLGMSDKDLDNLFIVASSLTL